MTKLLTSGILFSTAANLFLVTRSLCFFVSLIFNFIFFSASKVSLSCAAFKTNFVVSMLSTFVTNLSLSVFLTTSFFTTLLNFAKSLGTGANLSISSLSTSVVRLAKFDFSAKLLISTRDIFFKSVLVPN